MYKLKTLTVFFIISLGFQYANAQTDIDAYRYSTPLNLGTARSAAIGNAVSGLGGDISSLNSNPAGIAQITLSEFGLSAGINMTRSKSNYLGTQTSAKKSAFELNNAQLAYVPKRNFKHIKNITIAASYNRTASFNYRIQASGVNHNSSYSDIYADELNQAGVDSAGALNNYPFGSSLAFEAGIIGLDQANHLFYPITELPITQSYDIKREGHQDQISLGGAVSLNEHWQIGLSLGMPIIRYQERFYVNETDAAQVTPDLNFWEKSDQYRSEGNGINASIGVLFHATPNIRLGASFTTPTRYSMHDQYLTLMKADYETFTLDNFNNPAEGYFDYKLKTPLKTNIGASYVNPKWGFISAEYEYSDPGKTKYVFSNQNGDLSSFESNINQQISSKYKATHTIKIGIEGVIAQYFRVRGGYQYRTSGFSNQESFNNLVKNSVMAYSGGLGYRGKNIYADLAYVQVVSDELFVPYTASTAAPDPLSSKYHRSNVVLTIGVKF